MSSPQQPPLPPLLPQELIDAIVDNLRGDKESLASCSLACRAWSTRSSRYLCRRSLCRVTKISVLLESLVKSERLPFSVQELILEGVAGADRDDELEITSLSALLARLPKLQVLELRRVHLQVHSEVKVLDLPPFALRLFKLRDIAELQSLDKVLRLFSSITELSLESVRSARFRPSPIRTPIDTTIQRLVCVKSEPTVLSTVLKEIQGFITPRLVHLTMDDGIFFHTHLAMKFNTLLRQVGPMLNSIHFKITPENYSLSAPGTSNTRLRDTTTYSIKLQVPLCHRSTPVPTYDRSVLASRCAREEGGIGPETSSISPLPAISSARSAIGHPSLQIGYIPPSTFKTRMAAPDTRLLWSILANCLGTYCRTLSRALAVQGAWYLWRRGCSSTLWGRQAEARRSRGRRRG